MFGQMLTKMAGTFLRHGLNAIGTWLVAAGVLDAGAAANFVEAITGGVLILAAGFLSYLNSRYLEKKDPEAE